MAKRPQEKVTEMKRNNAIKLLRLFTALKPLSVEKISVYTTKLDEATFLNSDIFAHSLWQFHCIHFLWYFGVPSTVICSKSFCIFHYKLQYNMK